MSQAAMFKPNPLRREALVKLRDYVRALPHGARRSWVEIEQETGIEMRTTEARALFSAALDAEKIPKIALKGSGVELAGPTNAAEIVDKASNRIVNAIGDAVKTGERVCDRVLPALGSEEQKALLLKTSKLQTLAQFVRSTKEVKRLS